MEIGGAGEFSQCGSVEEVADEMLSYQPLYRPVTQRERKDLIDLLTEQGNAVQEYLAALKAKPINGEHIFTASASKN